VTAEQRVQINKLADAMFEAAKRQRETKNAWEGLNDTVRYFGNMAGDVLDVLTDKTKTWSDFTITAARNVAKELMRAAITGEGAFAKILGLASASSGGTGGLGGALVSLFKGSPSGASAASAPLSIVGGAGSMPVPTFAGGGTVPPNTDFIYAEHSPDGPKYGRSGSRPIPVTPNDLSGGPGDMHLNMPVTVNAPGASRDDAAAIASAVAREMKASIIPTVRDALRRRQL
jgi:hypothetical protein